MRESIGNEGAQLVLKLAALDESIAQGDEGDWNLTCLIASSADYAALLDRRMLEQHRFDFGGSYREALVLDHLFAAIDDAVEAFAVARDDVARPVPAIAKNSSRGGGLVPVAEHELRPAHDKFTRLSGRSFREVVGSIGGIDVRLRQDAAIRLCDWQSDRIGMIESGIKGSEMGDGRSLGHPVSLADENIRQRGDAAGKIGSERRCS